MPEKCVDTEGNAFVWEPNESEKFESESYWDGSNHISIATGSQWSDEYLYRTKKGTWILDHSFRTQGTKDYSEIISENEAAEWLIKAENWENVKKYFPEQYNEKIV